MSVPTTMRAVVPLHADHNAGGPVGVAYSDLGRFAALADLPVPTPGPGQVLVRVRRAAVNPSDLHYLAGEYGLPRRPDAAAGFEGTGEVVACGPGWSLPALYARRLVGRRVAFGVGPDGGGSWAEYALTDAAAAIPVGDAIRDEDAAALLVNPFTAWAMVDDAIRRHRPRAEMGAKGNVKGNVKGGTMPAIVLTAGASQLSRLALTLAKERALPTIAVVRREAQRAELLDAGASAVLVTTAEGFDAERDDAFARLRPLTLLDAVGDEVSSALVGAMGRGAHWIVYGGLAAGVPPGLSPLDAIFRGKVMRGFWLSDWLGQAPIARRLACAREVRARFSDGRWSTRVAASVPLARVMDDLLPAPREGGKVQIAMAG